MIETAEVKLWNNTVGAVHWVADRNLGVFEFDSKFLDNGLDISPIMMPISKALRGERIFTFNINPETYQGLPGLLADSLPDDFGNTLIDQWLRKQNRTKASFNPVERLCYVGERGMGALEFHPSKSFTKPESKSIEVQELVDIANIILQERGDFSTNFNKKQEEALSDLIKVGTSAGGARAKAIIAFNESTEEIRSGQVTAPNEFTYWLIKLDGVNTDREVIGAQGYGRIEYAYYLMTQDCEINMTECRLLEKNGYAHFMTKRFDRTNQGEKFHLQTLCGLAHMDFKKARTYDYEDIFEIMRILHLPYSDMEQLYRRMVFNVIARNQDDHTKNFSFMMAKTGLWRLSPAYDVVYAYNPEKYWTSLHQMNINGKNDDFVLDDLLAVAKRVNITRAKKIIDQTLGVINDWKDYAKKAGVLDSHIKSIAQTHRLAWNK